MEILVRHLVGSLNEIIDAVAISIFVLLKSFRKELAKHWLRIVAVEEVRKNLFDLNIQKMQVKTKLGRFDSQLRFFDGFVQVELCNDWTQVGKLESFAEKAPVFIEGVYLCENHKKSLIWTKIKILCIILLFLNKTVSCLFIWL